MHAAEHKLNGQTPHASTEVLKDTVHGASNAAPKAMLLVDDELPILRSLQRLLRRQDFPVITASSGAEALQLLKENEVAVVVSDYRMPEMNGVQLLDQVRELHPDTVRIILTGQADMEAVVGAVNRGAVYKFFTKPWQTQELTQELCDAHRRHGLEEEKLRLNNSLQLVNEDLKNTVDGLRQNVEDKSRALDQAVHYDALTGLANRAHIAELLTDTLVEAKQDNKQSAVLVFGLDRFKLINESCGQHGGDQLLKALSERFKQTVRDGDGLARTSGDEFGFVVGAIESVQDSAGMAQRLLDSLKEPFEINGQEVFTSGSVGISLFPGDGDTAESLIRHAASAMHHAKEEGGNTYFYYAEQFNEQAQHRVVLERELRRAIEREEFSLYYQPRVSSTGSGIHGAEALLRWNHPERGWVSPLEFVPLLEETGLIETVGAWVIKEACQALKRWDTEGLPPVRVSVNLSPLQFWQGDLEATVTDALANAELDPADGLLELEVTESLLMKHEDKTLSLLTSFRELGIPVALDDFGTGYSSLSYLTRFPIDYLKIDRSFISEITEREESAALVRAIISMARALKMKAVAEGVETDEQREFLQELGCDELQGYLYSAPRPEDEFKEWLQKNL